jgi:uncharacterized YigZ family protein
MDSFKSIKSEAINEYKEKGSKFLAYAYPFSSENDLKNILENLRIQHPNAVHFCYAYRLGNAGEIYRANDDGEPSGSAGKPILNQLLSFELTEVLVVVVRYFGGTKLGVSGLIQAYKEATKMALETSKIIEKSISEKVKISFGYELTSEVKQIIAQYQLEIIDETFETICKKTLNVPVSLVQPIKEKFNQFEYKGLLVE